VLLSILPLRGADIFVIPKEIPADVRNRITFFNKYVNAERDDGDNMNLVRFMKEKAFGPVRSRLLRTSQ
jgi:hypothetical protein